MSYALLHWYQGDGNKYTFLGFISKEEYLSANMPKGLNFSLFACISNSTAPEVWNKTYVDESGNKYTSKNGSFWIQS